MSIRRLSPIHMAAMHNTLPEDFNQWDIADPDGWSIAHEYVQYRQLPKDFDQWELSTKDDLTVAQVAFNFGHLPNSFNRWDLIKIGDVFNNLTVEQINKVIVENVLNNIKPLIVDICKECTKENLSTINKEEITSSEELTFEAFEALHEQIKNGELPEDFDHWDINDHNVKTLVREAAKYITFPKDFKFWNLKDNEGISVAHIAAKYRKLPTDFSQWNIKDNNGWTVAHEAIKHYKLPNDFTLWGLANKNGWSVAHEGALEDHLPGWFNMWDISDNNRITVRGVYLNRYLFDSENNKPYSDIFSKKYVNHLTNLKDVRIISDKERQEIPVEEDPEIPMKTITINFKVPNDWKLPISEDSNRLNLTFKDKNLSNFFDSIKDLF